MKMQDVSLYRREDGNHWVADKPPETSAALAPGLYQYGTDMNGRLHFIQQDIPGIKVHAVDPEQNAILSEVASFWAAADFYKARGFQHKRGFLLYGPPGTGKTTTVRLIMNQVFGLGGVALQLNIHRLPMALSAIRQIQGQVPVMVLIEEVDRFMDSDNEGPLLELMDGMVDVDGVMFLATTNHLVRVKPRFKSRPSRFDRVIPVGYPTEDCRREFILKSASDLGRAEIEGLVEKTKGLSIAHVKEVLIREKVFGGVSRDVLKEFQSQCSLPMMGVTMETEAEQEKESEEE